MLSNHLILETGKLRNQALIFLFPVQTELHDNQLLDTGKFLFIEVFQLIKTNDRACASLLYNFSELVYLGSGHHWSQKSSRRHVVPEGSTLDHLWRGLNKKIECESDQTSKSKYHHRIYREKLQGEKCEINSDFTY